MTTTPVLAQAEDHGYVKVREGILQQWKDIYEDQTLKDVEITFCDGDKVMADSLVLRRASAVFNAMLTHNMLERRTMSLQLDDCPSHAFRFFLRLLYTGSMDPTDWPAEETEQRESQGMPPAPERDAATVGEQATVLPIDHANSLPATPGNVGRPQSIPGTLFVEAQGVFGAPTTINVFGERLMAPPPSAKGPGLASMAPPPSARGQWLAPAGSSDIPKAAAWGHSFCSPQPQAPRPPLPPLDLLLTAAALAKKYQVEWLLSVLVDVLKKRVSDDSFECILMAAMRMDLSPVRLCALEFAKTSSVLRSRYEAGDFSPDIIFEMQAVFPVRENRGSDLSI